MTLQVTIDEELAGLMDALGDPADHLDAKVREWLVLDLYRRGRISSGKAARLLGMDRVAFIQYSSDLGIPFFDMTESEWQAEAATARNFPIDRRLEH
jgi:predicted HTH domain antitoxin